MSQSAKQDLMKWYSQLLLCCRDDHYLVFQLDIQQDSEFAAGYGYPKTVFKWERDKDI